MTYREFCNIFLPSDPQLADALMARKLGQISVETADVMGTLLKAHLDLEQSREYLRQKLSAKMDQKTWSEADLFEAVDQDGKGYLTIRDFEAVMKKLGHKELEELVAMYDTVGNRKVTFQDF